MQVGLTDMLAEEYGIVPAGFLGHSAGEIACGYADGGFTREQVQTHVAVDLKKCRVKGQFCDDSASPLLAKVAHACPCF